MKLEELLSLLDADGYLDVGPCHGTTAKKIDSLALLPNSLKRIFTMHWPNTADAMCGPYRIRSAGQILAPADLELLLPHKFIAIGDALCGDLFVLRFADGGTETGLLNHENVWTDVSTPSEAYIRVTDSLTDFFLSVWEDRKLPIDYFAAGRE